MIKFVEYSLKFIETSSKQVDEYSLSFLILRSADETPFSTPLSRGVAKIFIYSDSGYFSFYTLVSRWALLARNHRI
jgi:hypothetical protein